MGNLEKLLVVGVLVVVIAILGISLFWTNDVATLPEAPAGTTSEMAAGTPVGDLGIGAQPLSVVSPNPASPATATGATPLDSTAAPGVGVTPNLMANQPVSTPMTAGEENYASYTIKSGDTLDKIAKAHKVSVAEIMKLNEGLDPKRLRIGKTLLLPKDAGGAVLSGSTPADTKSPSASKPAESTAKELNKEPAKKSEELVPTGRVTNYTVEKGDTFWKIAKKVYGDGAQWKKILNANKEKCPTENSLKPGMKLSIP